MFVFKGSCQVYKAIKEGHKKEKHVHTASRPASSTKKLHRESTGLFPNIHRNRNGKLLFNLLI